MLDRLKALGQQFFSSDVSVSNTSGVKKEEHYKSHAKNDEYPDEYPDGYIGECMWRLRACERFQKSIEVEFLAQLEAFNTIDQACMLAEARRVDIAFPTEKELIMIAQRDAERVKKIGLEGLLKESRTEIEKLKSVIEAEDSLAVYADRIKKGFSTVRALKDEIRKLDIDLLFDVELGNGDLDGQKGKSIAELRSDLENNQDKLSSDIASYFSCASTIANSMLKDLVSSCSWNVAKILALYDYGSPVLRVEVDVIAVENEKLRIDSTLPDLSMAYGVRGKLQAALSELELESANLREKRLQYKDRASDLDVVELEIEKARVKIVEMSSHRGGVGEPSENEIAEEVKLRKLTKAADELRNKITKLGIECSRYGDDVESLNQICGKYLDEVVELDIVEYRRNRIEHYKSVVGDLSGDAGDEKDLHVVIDKCRTRIKTLSKVNSDQFALVCKEDSEIVGVRAQIRKLEKLLEPAKADVEHATNTSRDDIKNEIMLRERQIELGKLTESRNKLVETHLKTTNEIADSYNFYCNCLLLLAKAELDAFVTKHSKTLARVVAMCNRPDRSFILETDGDLLLSAKHMLRREIPNLGFCVIGDRPNLS